MKKITATFLAVLVLSCSAVPALAAVNIGTDSLINSPLGQAGFVVEEDGVPYVQTFVVSTLTAEQRAIYDRFVALPNNRKLMVGYSVGGSVSLMIPASGAKITGNGADASIAIEAFISFSPTNGKLNYLSSMNTSYSTKFSPGAYLIMGQEFAQDIVNGTSSNPNSNFLKYYPQSGQVGWRDDEEPEPSEPEPPTPSKPETEPIPPWNPGKAPPPSTANKSPYVPYDVSVWDDFIAYLRTASGSATNIILLLIIPTIIIPAIISTFKHFTSGGKGGGGGKTL